MPKNVLFVQDVAKMLKISPSKVNRLCDDSRKGKNRFPLPIRIKGKQRRWLLSDIVTYLASQ